MICINGKVLIANIVSAHGDRVEAEIEIGGGPRSETVIGTGGGNSDGDGETRPAATDPRDVITATRI